MNAPALPDHLQKHPRLGQWLDVGPDGRIRAYSGKVDIGQGILHALCLIVAEELQVTPEQIAMVPPSTITSPDEAVTSGSLSIQQSGTALRHAAAHLREVCRNRFAQLHVVSRDSVTLENGVFSITSNLPARYCDLVNSDMLTEAVDPKYLAARGGRPSVFGDARRTDIEAKVFGDFEYINDLVLPHMCYGQVFRPKTLQADIDRTLVTALIPALTGQQGIIKVVHDGVLIGVLAESEHVLSLAAKRIDKANPWRAPSSDAAPSVPTASQIPAWLKSQTMDTTVILDQKPERSAPPAAQARVFRAEFGRAWLQHASIGLCCAIAHWSNSTLQVWTHSQGIFNLRRDLALAFGMPADAVTVCHADGAGCYGHNGADDVAFDAAWLAQHADGRPVRLQWTRQQEMANSPMGPAMTVAVEAGVDEVGNLLSWKQEVWSQGHGSRPGRGKTPALLGSWQTAEPFPVTIAVNQPPTIGGGSDRNAVPPYAIPEVHVVNHRVLAMPLRVSALRSLGAHVNVLAAESTIDEIARTLGLDPLEYRMAHLPDARGKAVLNEVARLSSWSARKPANAPEGFGRGIAYARYKNTSGYCAVVAELVAEEDVRLTRLFIAADLGLVVHPDGARNQIEGGAIQAASWTLREAADVSAKGIRSDDWESYPIFTFGDAPKVEVALIDRPDSPSLGAGECSAGPTAAAISNAIYDALGVRMRMMPFNADRLMSEAQSGQSDLF